MRVYLTLFLIIVWTFLILVPLKVYADEVTFTCKPVVAGMPKKDGSFYVEDISEKSTPILDIIPDNQLLLRGKAKHMYFKNNSSRNFEPLIPYEKCLGFGVDASNVPYVSLIFPILITSSVGFA